MPMQSYYMTLIIADDTAQLCAADATKKKPSSFFPSIIIVPFILGNVCAHAYSHYLDLIQLDV